MRQKLIYSGFFGGVFGYAFTLHLLAVFHPFAPAGMDDIGGRLVFLGCAVFAFAVVAYLIFRKIDFSVFTLHFPRFIYQKILSIALLVVMAFSVVLGGNYFLHGWLFPPTTHEIELTYIDGYIKITRILLPDKELIDFSTLEYLPEDAWEIDTQNVNAIRSYARLVFSTGNVDYVKFFFATNSEGLVYLNVDGRMRSVVIQADSGDYLQPLAFLNLPSRLGKLVVLTLWMNDAVLLFGLLFLIFMVKGWKPFFKSVVLPYCARSAGSFVAMVVFLPYASSSAYPWLSSINVCFTSNSCQFLPLSANVSFWWYVLGGIGLLLVWELADQYRRISTPVVLALGGVLAVIMLSMNVAHDLIRLPLSLDECLSASADGCLIQYRTDHSLDEMYGRRTAIQVAGYLNEHFPGSRLIVPEDLYTETFYWIGLQPGPVFEGEMEIVPTALPLTVVEEDYLLDFAYTYYRQLQETDTTDYPIYLIHPEDIAADTPVFYARLGTDNSVFVYPEALLP